MQFLIVFISYLVNTQHVSSDIRSSSGVLFTIHTAAGYLCCYHFVSLLNCTEMHGTKNIKFKNKPFIIIFRLLLSNYKLFQYIFSHIGP
jgi:hypothetical protein